MSEIRCPYCGEDDRGNILIIEDGKKLKCDKCGRLFDKEHPLFGSQEPPQDYRIFNRRQPDGNYRPLSEYWDPIKDGPREWEGGYFGYASAVPRLNR